MGLSGTEAGSAVIQKPIDFRELLENVLPLDELEAADRVRIRRALDAGTPGGIAQAAQLALTELEQRGALRRLSSERAGIRYETRDALDVITVPAPASPDAPAGVSRHARHDLPARTRTGLDQIRRLLRLDDHVLFGESGLRDAVAALAAPLAQIGRELLGASELKFVPAADGDAESDGARPGRFAQRDAAAVFHHAERSRLWTAVVDGSGTVRGHLEARADTPNAFTPEAFSLLSLLADHTADLLERSDRIEHLVFVDPMTGVYNRSYFDLQLHNEIARADREGASMALCIVDVDDFKAFNTRYGYEAGNTVLTEVAHALKRGVRPFDTVARWGGEEFAVLLTAPVQATDVLTICERLRSRIGDLELELTGLDRQRHRVNVTVSLGVAMSPDHARTAEDVWRAANQALLVAKKPPKNQVVFYSAG